jgi:ribonuclease BN (tRNA processing enzyme)
MQSVSTSEAAGPAMKITPLGTNGFIPSYGRRTMSFLVESEGKALVLDGGTGLSRLLEEPLRQRLEAYQELEILLTHYHLDHVVGLSYLPAVWQRGLLTLWAPSAPLVDTNAHEALERLLSPPLFPVAVSEFPGPVEVRAYDGEEPLAVMGRPVRLRRQQHGGGSVGIALEEGLVYLTDCEADEESAPFARGARLLIHDVWVTEGEVAAGAPRHGHSTVEQVARLAREAEVATVMPVHHRPDRRDQELEEMAEQLRQLSGCQVILAVEGETYSLPPAS